MKILYIEKMDKPKWYSKKIDIEQDNCYVGLDLTKERNIKKIIKKIIKMEFSGVVLCKELLENNEFKNSLNASNINIFEGRWLKRYLSLKILDYIIDEKNFKKEETEIAIAVNQLTDLSIYLIKSLAKQYKRLNVVTNHIEKFQEIESQIYEKEGILISISNNHKKSLLKPQIIMNIDFNTETLNKYRINESAIIINLQDEIKIESKRFNGLCINNYDIEIGRGDIVWRKNMKKFREKDLYEANIYMRDSFESIYNIINKSKISIKELYGINGKI